MRSDRVGGEAEIHPASDQAIWLSPKQGSVLLQRVCAAQTGGLFGSSKGVRKLKQKSFGLQ